MGGRGVLSHRGVRESPGSLGEFRGASGRVSGTRLGHVAQKEAEAIWGGARSCEGFGWQLCPSRVHRDLCAQKEAEAIWGVGAF